MSDYTLASINEATERLTEAMAQFAEALAKEMNPPLYAMSHEFHVWWFDGLPWYRQWWHLVTARHSFRDFVPPVGETDQP